MSTPPSKWKKETQPFVGFQFCLEIFPDVPLDLIKMIYDYAFENSKTIIEADRALNYFLPIPSNVMEIVRDFEPLCSADRAFAAFVFTGCQGIPYGYPYVSSEFGTVRHLKSKKQCVLHSECWQRIINLQFAHYQRRQSLFCLCGEVVISFTEKDDVTTYIPVYHPPFATHECNFKCGWTQLCDQQHPEADPSVICLISSCPSCPQVEYDSDDNSVHPPYSDGDEIVFHVCN